MVSDMHVLLRHASTASCSSSSRTLLPALAAQLRHVDLHGGRAASKTGRRHGVRSPCTGRRARAALAGALTAAAASLVDAALRRPARHDRGRGRGDCRPRLGVARGARRPRRRDRSPTSGRSGSASRTSGVPLLGSRRSRGTAHRGRDAGVRRGHDDRHHPARGRHRGARHQHDQGLLRGAGDHRPHPAQRARPRGAPPRGAGRPTPPPASPRRHRPVRGRATGGHRSRAPRGRRHLASQVALAMVHRDAFEAGTLVAIGGLSGPPATVRELPLVPWMSSGIGPDDA